MGRFRTVLIDHNRLGLDTSVWIYQFERHPRYMALTQELLKGIEAGMWLGVVSTVVLMEIAVRPWQLGRADIVRAYEEAVIGFPNVTVRDVDAAVAREAARLRAQYHLRPADALHAATALVSGATMFITNDRDFTRLASELEVLVLEDLA